MDEPILRVERVFNLGDYKSLRCTAMQDGTEHLERQLIMIDNIADAFEQFFTHQRMQFELDDRDAAKWIDGQEKVNELREQYKQELLLVEEEEEN